MNIIEFLFCPQDGLIRLCWPIIPTLLSFAAIYVRRMCSWISC